MTDPHKEPESISAAKKTGSGPSAFVSILFAALGGLIFLAQLLSLFSGSYKARALNGDEAFGALLATLMIAALSGWLCYHGVKRLMRPKR